MEEGGGRGHGVGRAGFGGWGWEEGAGWGCRAQGGSTSGFPKQGAWGADPQGPRGAPRAPFRGPRPYWGLVGILQEAYWSRPCPSLCPGTAPTGPYREVGRGGSPRPVRGCSPTNSGTPDPIPATVGPSFVPVPVVQEFYRKLGSGDPGRWGKGLPPLIRTPRTGFGRWLVRPLSRYRSYRGSTGAGPYRGVPGG